MIECGSELIEFYSLNLIEALLLIDTFLISGKVSTVTANIKKHLTIFD